MNLQCHTYAWECRLMRTDWLLGVIAVLLLLILFADLGVLH